MTNEIERGLWDTIRTLAAFWRGYYFISFRSCFDKFDMCQRSPDQPICCFSQKNFFNLLFLFKKKIWMEIILITKLYRTVLSFRSDWCSWQTKPIRKFIVYMNIFILNSVEKKYIQGCDAILLVRDFHLFVERYKKKNQKNIYKEEEDKWHIAETYLYVMVDDAYIISNSPVTSYIHTLGFIYYVLYTEFGPFG
jgi:hypothetical protein